MFQFENKIVSSSIARFKMIVEQAEPYNFSGVLYNEYYGFNLEFQGIRQLLGRLDDFFDYVEFPQATHEIRTFDDHKGQKAKKVPQGIRNVTHEEMMGKQASLILHVQFRQNSTWQGTITWMSEDKTKRFRSELEMISIIGEILNSRVSD
ncbi:hypothetical protein FRZ06_08465 [Anoxybacterium hadale]|uniref:Uncharacterized protein n=1 Tax=Anoxybacterium hadale TaxID=3408580 RepID=A0ACD1AA41_9FIRM|nr:hypothetical protein FRZ06_08465 [Clostridiales bacterium]